VNVSNGYIKILNHRRINLLHPTNILLEHLGFTNKIKKILPFLAAEYCMFPHTEFDFSLPKGLVDEHGHVHRHGKMRLTRARDEIELMKDQRIQREPAYESILRLAQVITVLGDLTTPTPAQLEQLFSIDLAYLQEFYNRINYQDDTHIPVQCPQCQAHFEVEFELSGE
jgi:hypothetical protein